MVRQDSATGDPVMPVFHVTAPDGRTIEVTSPEGATEQQAIEYAQQHLETVAPVAEKTGPPGIGTQLLDVGKDIAGTVARGAGTAVGVAKNVGHMLAGEPHENPSETGAAWHVPFEHPEDTEPTIHRALDVATGMIPGMSVQRDVGELARQGVNALPENERQLVTDVAHPIGDIAQGVGTVLGAKDAIGRGIVSIPAARRAGSYLSDIAPGGANRAATRLIRQYAGGQEAANAAAGNIQAHVAAQRALDQAG